MQYTLGMIMGGMAVAIGIWPSVPLVIRISLAALVAAIGGMLVRQLPC